MTISIKEIVSVGQERGASDIHLCCGVPPKGRVDGKLTNLFEEPLTHEDCENLGREMAGAKYAKMEEIGELDLALTINDSRCRINLFREQGHCSCALRILHDGIPPLDKLGLPPVIHQIPNWQKGIVLVTGETGSGKSTTMASLLNEINKTRYEHIITLEDPIEYIYKPDKSLISQREVGKDTVSYAEGLRAILREDPDIILIGEMRDAITIETALTAAETGHLVFATLHTNSAVDSVDRIVGTFPADRHNQIRMQLSTTLNAVLSQQLLVRKSGKGRILACEIMIVTPALRNQIREGKTPQMQSSLLAGAKDGSVTMDNYILDLYRRNEISLSTAIEAANDQEYIKQRIGGR